MGRNLRLNPMKLPLPYFLFYMTAILPSNSCRVSTIWRLVKDNSSLDEDGLLEMERNGKS